MTPAILWVNPFYALLAMIASLEPQNSFGSSGGDTRGEAIAFYFVFTLLASAAGLAWMAARYRRAARE